jgi:hypothetical protein
VVGNLTIAMAKTAQFHQLSHPSHGWVAPPVAKVLSDSAFCFKMPKTCEGSLHPRPEGRGIRDPPRSRSNENSIDFAFNNLSYFTSARPEEVTQDVSRAIF